MKRSRTARIVLGIAASLMILSLSSCGLLFSNILPDYFEFDGQSYDISNVYVENTGLTDAGYDIALIFTSPGLSYSTSNGYSGSGRYAVFYLLSDESDIAIGTYTFSDAETDDETFYFGETGEVEDGAFSGTYSNANGGEILIWRPLIGGTLTVNLAVYTPEGSIEGQYRGEVIDL